MKRQTTMMEGNSGQKKKSNMSTIVQILQTPVDNRTTHHQKIVKNFAQTKIPLMEPGYCHNDDYTFISERLEYQFVPKGHYAVRQGDTANKIYFIIQGTAVVLQSGPPDEKAFLDQRQMYNEHALNKAKKHFQNRGMSRTGTLLEHSMTMAMDESEEPTPNDQSQH